MRERNNRKMKKGVCFFLLEREMKIKKKIRKDDPLPITVERKKGKRKKAKKRNKRSTEGKGKKKRLDLW